jgi:hypothetical protein
MNSIINYHIPFKLMVNTPVIGNCIQYIYLTKITNFVDNILPNLERREDVAEGLINFNYSIDKIEKVVHSLSWKIHLVASAAITMLVTACFGFIPGILAVGVCLGSITHSFLLITPFASRQKEIKNEIDKHFDRIKALI